MQPDIQLSRKWRTSAAPVLDSSAPAHERADEKESTHQTHTFDAVTLSAAVPEAVLAALRARCKTCSRTGHSADSPAVLPALSAQAALREVGAHP